MLLAVLALTVLLLVAPLLVLLTMLAVPLPPAAVLLRVRAGGGALLAPGCFWELGGEELLAAGVGARSVGGEEEDMGTPPTAG
jgi:hypothetical protein